MTEDIVAALNDTELLQSLSPAECARILEVGRIEYWRDDALVLEEGAHGPRMMVILAGQVEVLRRDRAGVERAIARLGPGEVLGELSLLLDVPRTATVRALSELKVFAMDRQAFIELVDASDPALIKLGLQLSRVLARRLVTLNDRVLDLLSESADLRERFGEARQEVFHLWEVD